MEEEGKRKRGEGVPGGMGSERKRKKAKKNFFKFSLPSLPIFAGGYKYIVALSAG